MDKTLLAVVNNEPEVLMRITALLRRGGWSMRKISMEETVDPSLALLSMTIAHQQGSIQRTISQIEKFVDVHEIREIEQYIPSEELALSSLFTKTKDVWA
ncbi:MAG: ACT domain-containing protein [Bacillota bacterium]